jgi:hypothetical protein
MDTKKGTFETNFNGLTGMSDEWLVDPTGVDPKRIVFTLNVQGEAKFYGPDGEVVLQVDPPTPLDGDVINPILDKAWGVEGFGAAAQFAYMNAMLNIRARLEEKANDEVALSKPNGGKPTLQ